jgi:hypothetical protein
MAGSAATSETPCELEVLEGDALAQALHIVATPEGRLGGGAAGRVFRATFRGQQTAIKVMHPQQGMWCR